MFSLRKPSPDAVRDLLAAQAPLAFTYPGVGTTATAPPAGYTIDHTRVKLGEGEGVFVAAKAALARWDHFPNGWVESAPRDAPIVPGTSVAIIAHVMGFWWANVCRIVYVVDESGPVSRFGFAYGTTPDHVESGEERFLIEWDRADNSVWYDILAFSRPRFFLARLGYPLTRRTQKRFARDSVTALQRAIAHT